MFKVKADNIHEGRVLVQSWGQLPTVECGGMYDQLCRIQSTRLAPAVAAEHNWEVLHLDLMTALLNAKLQEDVYVITPPGYGSIDKAT